MEKKLEAETYTSYDLALDNRDALKSDVYKNAENYYKSVFENKGGSINFYPDKKTVRFRPQRLITERLRKFPYRR